MVHTFYRIVKTNPPTLGDFHSHKALGKPLINEDDRELWEGISCQATEQQARNKAKLPGFGKYIARLVVPDDGPITWRRTTRSQGHHTLWGAPTEFPPYIVEVIPV